MACCKRLLTSFLTVVTGIFIFVLAPPPLEGAMAEHRTEVSGLVTGVTGSPTARGPASDAPRSLSLGDTVSVAQEVRTRLDETIEILWDRRAVILLQPQSGVSIREPKPGETHVTLAGGTVRVALAYGSGPNDLVTVQTPTSRVVTRGGIVEVDVLPPSPSFMSRVSSAFSRADSSSAPAPLEAVRVLEGQSSVESLQSPPRSQTLEAGVAARIVSGTVGQVAELPLAPGNRIGLAATDRRHATPVPLTRNIVRVHVDHALEVERLMSSASAPGMDQTVKAPGTDVKGAIVATSLGVPTASFASAGATGGGIPSPGAGSPPVAPTMTSPLPTLPPIQIPTVVTQAPNQSGGVNSRAIIKDLLSDIQEKTKGKGKGRGKKD